MQTRNYIIPENLSGERLDKALSQIIEEVSRSAIQKAIKSLNVLVNNHLVSNPTFKVSNNDKVEITLYHESVPIMEGRDIKFEIVFEDEYLLVINKPAGLTVHPGAGNSNNTLANGLIYYSNSLSDLGGMIRPGIVHRLDKDTSGLMVVAKNNFIHAQLAEKIKNRNLERKYKALVWGMLNPTKGEIEENIARNKIDRKKMSIVKFGGKKALTFYSTDQIFLGGKISLLTCKLQTGRTHQIRVHLSHKGHSVVGDPVYGHNKRKIITLPENIRDYVSEFDRQALHSYYLAFIHPMTKEFKEFQIDLADDMKNLIKNLSK